MQGDGLEFKRCFLKIRESLLLIIDQKDQNQALAWASTKTPKKPQNKDNKENEGSLNSAGVLGDASKPSSELQLGDDADVSEQNQDKEETNKNSLLVKSYTTTF